MNLSDFEVHRKILPPITLPEIERLRDSLIADAAAVRLGTKEPGLNLHIAAYMLRANEGTIVPEWLSPITTVTDIHGPTAKPRLCMKVHRFQFHFPEFHP